MLESFTPNAADLIRLRRALYGPEQAQSLILRCFKRRPASVKINLRTAETAWAELDAEIHAQLDQCGAE